MRSFLFAAVAALGLSGCTVANQAAGTLAQAMLGSGEQQHAAPNVGRFAPIRELPTRRDAVLASLKAEAGEKFSYRIGQTWDYGVITAGSRSGDCRSFEEKISGKDPHPGTVCENGSIN